MKRSACFLVCLWLLAWWLPGGVMARDFEHGARPPDGVFDPLGLLDRNTLREISAPLPGMFEDEGVEVIVVVMDDLGDAPPEFVAGRFADAWCTAPVHAVVLHVPGHKGSPWIIPRGKLFRLIQPHVVAERLARANRNASREPTEAGKVRAATVEAADMLRFWLNSSEIVEVMMAAARREGMNKAMHEAKVGRIRLFVVAGSAILLVIGTLLLLVWWRKPKRRTFPDFHPPRRMGAPHGGGNHAVLRIQPPNHPES